MQDRISKIKQSNEQTAGKVRSLYSYLHSKSWSHFSSSTLYSCQLSKAVFNCDSSSPGLHRLHQLNIYGGQTWSMMQKKWNTNSVSKEVIHFSVISVKVRNLFFVYHVQNCSSYFKGIIFKKSSILHPRIQYWICKRRSGRQMTYETCGPSG